MMVRAATFVEEMGFRVHRLATLEELTQLEPVVLTLDGVDIAVVRVEDEAYAFSPTCTHRAAPLIKGAVTWKRTILCPWHLGTFSLRDGRAMAGPQSSPLPTYPLTIRDGVVFLDAEPADLEQVPPFGQAPACVAP
jgi:nitrite reductase/ring-hydroxylating ferredoxin subunit